MASSGFGMILLLETDCGIIYRLLFGFGVLYPKRPEFSHLLSSLDSSVGKYSFL